MKVLHITNLYPTPENVAYGTFVKDQIESLKKVGIKCDVLLINARAKGKLQYVKAIKRIRQCMNDYDVIHCHHTYPAFVAIIGMPGSKKIITSFLCPGGKEGKSNRFHWIKEQIHAYVRNRSTDFIVKDNWKINTLTKSRGHYVPNGVDLSFFRNISKSEAFNRLNISPGNYILFCSSVSHLRQEKRYDLFRKTIEILQNKYSQDVQELILSNKPRELVPLYLNAARVHLLTSDFEGSPNSVKEALACNIPVVSRDVGNVGKMLDNLEGCYVSKGGTPQELAFGVNQVLKYRRINGRQRIMDEKLDLMSTAHRIRDIYLKISNQNG